MTYCQCGGHTACVEQSPNGYCGTMIHRQLDISRRFTEITIMTMLIVSLS